MQYFIQPEVFSELLVIFENHIHELEAIITHLCYGNEDLSQFYILELANSIREDKFKFKFDAHFAVLGALFKIEGDDLQEFRLQVYFNSGDPALMTYL